MCVCVWIYVSVFDFRRSAFTACVSMGGIDDAREGLGLCVNWCGYMCVCVRGQTRFGVVRWRRLCKMRRGGEKREYTDGSRV